MAEVKATRPSPSSSMFLWPQLLILLRSLIERTFLDFDARGKLNRGTVQENWKQIQLDLQDEGTTVCSRTITSLSGWQRAPGGRTRKTTTLLKSMLTSQNTSFFRQRKQNKRFLVSYISSMFTEEKIRLSKERRPSPLWNVEEAQLCYGVVWLHLAQGESVQVTVKSVLERNTLPRSWLLQQDYDPEHIKAAKNEWEENVGPSTAIDRQYKKHLIAVID